MNQILLEWLHASIQGMLKNNCPRIFSHFSIDSAQVKTYSPKISQIKPNKTKRDNGSDGRRRFQARQHGTHREAARRMKQ
jgi:hypothetical protein